jgi:hypothetical protein
VGARADLVAKYESAHGVITDSAIAARERADRRSAIVVRGSKPGMHPSQKTIGQARPVVI